MEMIRLVSGSSNRELAKEISAYVNVPLTPVHMSKFKDGEIYVRLLDTVRGSDVFIIQSTCNNVNEHLMEMLILIDAAKRASANSINVIVPYYGYARQDRISHPREALTARLVANMIEVAGASRLVSVDFHSGQTQGFFNIPTDNMWGIPVLAAKLSGVQLVDPVVVSPDHGGVSRARFMAKLLDVPLAIVDKRRTAHNVSEVMNLIGDVAGRDAIMVDDMIDTGGTIINAAAALKKAGAGRIFVCATHPILSEDAAERLERSLIEKVFVTNTIPLAEHKQVSKIVQVSIAQLLGESIVRIYQQKSLTELYQKREAPASKK
ncbi:ribose-phosphate pyrophosphokinase [Candidatus Woesearchaeota archaeon CG1_02_57_44]|nr:MAG: ribose-phosphate pyrophosphokinase [Candidatus Woesearchaeota archaeon CG1_02_57_44]PIN68968.1 MAG: ribose-phosphate pyrophosphokinase [Candidatus Woesearchaeota archaeon CG11_big_fil_rev_8_21_14_0_20_57_5]